MVILSAFSFGQIFTESTENFRLIKEFYNQGCLKLSSQDYRRAIQDFNMAIKLEPKNPDAYFTRELAKYKSGGRNGACLDWRKARELGCNDANEKIKENGN